MNVILRLLSDVARIEDVLVLATVGVAFALPQAGSNWFHKVEQRLGGLARRRWQAVPLACWR